MSVGASRSNEELRLVAVNGCLGYGFDADSLAAGVEAGPDVIGADAGSTDPGPYYLGSGQSLVRPAQIRRDLGLALTKARAAKVPLIVGSAGMGGGEPNLQIFKRILLEIARDEGLHFKLATIHSEIDKERVLSALRAAASRRWPTCRNCPSATCATASASSARWAPSRLPRRSTRAPTWC